MNKMFVEYWSKASQRYAEKIIFPHLGDYGYNADMLCQKHCDQSASKTFVKNYDYPHKTPVQCLKFGKGTYYGKLYLGDFNLSKRKRHQIEEFFQMSYDDFVNIVTYGFENDEQTIEERLKSIS